MHSEKQFLFSLQGGLHNLYNKQTEQGEMVLLEFSTLVMMILIQFQFEEIHHYPFEGCQQHLPLLVVILVLHEKDQKGGGHENRKNGGHHVEVAFHELLQDGVVVVRCEWFENWRIVGVCLCAKDGEKKVNEGSQNWKEIRVLKHKEEFHLREMINSYRALFHVALSLQLLLFVNTFVCNPHLHQPSNLALFLRYQGEATYEKRVVGEEGVETEVVVVGMVVRDVALVILVVVVVVFVEIDGKAVVMGFVVKVVAVVGVGVGALGVVAGNEFVGRLFVGFQAFVVATLVLLLKSVEFVDVVLLHFLVGLLSRCVADDELLILLPVVVVAEKHQMLGDRYVNGVVGWKFS